ncbi:MAG: hypothetical protein B6241_14110 [Spirochaetaceae bacterium 4572_59]|nr:MAG: hypothetical protein B6241_14110 [Spirochaetaceae bacterium 4572_59]
MKETFARIPAEKREKIIQACIDEFAEFGYEKSSTDRIIKKAGISKGGLYEYISTKKELFLYIVEYSYTQLYDYLRERIKAEGLALPSDILDRNRLVSRLAIIFYLAHPRFISLINKTYHMGNREMEEQIHSCFASQFLDIFGDVELSGLNYPKEKILDLLSWLLHRTRQEFLQELEQNPNVQEVHDNYLKNWDFYHSVLAEGIYKK